MKIQIFNLECLQTDAYRDNNKIEWVGNNYLNIQFLTIALAYLKKTNKFAKIN